MRPQNKHHSPLTTPHSSHPTPHSPLPTPHSRRRRARAFSLIEVVIAVAIFAMAATVLMSAFVNALLARESAASNDLINADIRAVRMQLLLEPDIEAAEDGDEYETLNSGEASWEASIEPTDVVDLFRVQFSIRFSEPPEGHAAEYSETLYLLRPTWSEGDERSDLLQDKREALEESRGDYQF
jgi:general secretion pathway protein I